MFLCQEKKQHFLTWNNYIKPKIRFDFQEILSKQKDAILMNTGTRCVRRTDYNKVFYETE